MALNSSPRAMLSWLRKLPPVRSLESAFPAPRPWRLGTGEQVLPGCLLLGSVGRDGVPCWAAQQRRHGRQPPPGQDPPNRSSINKQGPGRASLDTGCKGPPRNGVGLGLGAQFVQAIGFPLAHLTAKPGHGILQFVVELGTDLIDQVFLFTVHIGGGRRFPSPLPGPAPARPAGQLPPLR